MLPMYYYYNMCIFCVYHCTIISDEANSEVQGCISSTGLLFPDVYTFLLLAKLIFNSQQSISKVY